MRKKKLQKQVSPSAKLRASSRSFFDMNIALVHDQLNEFGGAERVLLAISEMYPDAPIHTAYSRAGSPAAERFRNKDIRVSWVQNIPFFSTKLHSPLRFLASSIWNNFDFSGYDVIISSASWYITKGFGRKGSPSKDSGRSKTIEFCYCHTPPRWLYGYPTSVQWQKYPIVRMYATVIGFFMRHYDFTAAQRVNYFIANSKETARRIEKFYRRESVIIYPPIELPRHPKTKCGDYYLIVSRMVGGKGLRLAVETATQKGFHLKIVGMPAGYTSEFKSLKKYAGKKIEFLGQVPDTDLASLYAGARAFLALATDEDFGMTPVEAMSMGTPVIAYNGGGYRESVINGKTGVLFDTPTVQGLASAISHFEKMKKDWSHDCITQARKFSKERFQRELKKFVEAKIRAH
jgi:glycosyltransferase involved in cell wall biosynthesis